MNYTPPSDYEMLNDPMYAEWPECMYAKDALWKLIRAYNFKTVLDIGGNRGWHTRVFLKADKEVTVIDPWDCLDKDVKPFVKYIKCDYADYDFSDQFDCIWASAVLEHQRNIGFFLDKMFQDLKINGILAITVPPMESLLGGGHINSISPGCLIYHLLHAGFDLSDMRLKIYGYNLSLICRKTDTSQIPYSKNSALPLLDYKRHLPDYLVEAIEKYMKEHYGRGIYGEFFYHERLPGGIKYKW